MSSTVHAIDVLPVHHIRSIQIYKLSLTATVVRFRLGTELTMRLGDPRTRSIHCYSEWRRNGSGGVRLPKSYTSITVNCGGQIDQSSPIGSPCTRRFHWIIPAAFLDYENNINGW